MPEQIEYAVLRWDAGAKDYVIDRFEMKRERLRTRAEEEAPAETVTVEAPYTHPDGRTGTLRGTVYLAPLIRPAEIKAGPDGKPLWRPVVVAEQPSPHPWQRLTGPHYDLYPDHVTRYWEVEDRPIEDIKADRVAAIRAEGREALINALIEGGDPTETAKTVREALQAVDDAKTVREAHEAAIAAPERSQVREEG